MEATEAQAQLPEVVVVVQPRRAKRTSAQLEAQAEREPMYQHSLVDRLFTMAQAEAVHPSEELAELLGTQLAEMVQVQDQAVQPLQQTTDAVVVVE